MFLNSASECRALFFFIVDNFSNKEKEQTQMKLLKLSFCVHMIKGKRKVRRDTWPHGTEKYILLDYSLISYVLLS